MTQFLDRDMTNGIRAMLVGSTIWSRGVSVDLEKDCQGYSCATHHASTTWGVTFSLTYAWTQGNPLDLSAIPSKD